MTKSKKKTPILSGRKTAKTSIKDFLCDKCTFQSYVIMLLCSVLRVLGVLPLVMNRDGDDRYQI